MGGARHPGEVPVYEAVLVPVRRAFAHDRDGPRRDEYFFATDPATTAKTIVETFPGRWSIETTFQGLRAYLGLETTRGWCRQTVLPAAPGLSGLYSVVALLYARLSVRLTRPPASIGLPPAAIKRDEGS